jgi:hypothetical protein
VVAAAAHRVAAADPAVAGHEWLSRATEFCLAAAAEPGPAHAMELAFTVQFLDAASAASPAAVEALERLRPRVPATGLLHVDGGAEDEFMRPLDFAPSPGGPARSLFSPPVVDAELTRLAAAQQADGGWLVDFRSYSAAATLEWRGYRTVHALCLLRDNGLL